MQVVAPPTLSICIPSYNRSGFLRDLLLEIDRPDYLPFPFEVIVVDNASDDVGYREFETYRPHHHGFSYLRRASAVGPFQNLTGCLRMAQGVFCVYLADDDRLIAAMLARYVADMEAVPDIVATYAVFDEIDLTSNQITSRRPRFPDQLVSVDTLGPMIQVFREAAYLPEVGLFRTDALARSLLPHKAINNFALHLERIIRLGLVRFADEPFYQFVSGCAREPFPRRTMSRVPTLTIFDQSYRGHALLQLRFAEPKDAPPRPLAGMEHDYFTLILQSLDVAIGNNRPLEACELALLADGLLRRYAPGQALAQVAQLDDVVNLAGLEAVCLLAGEMPGIRSLTASGLDAAQSARFAEAAQRIETSKHLVLNTSAREAIERDDTRLVLTDTEVSRGLLIAEGRARPGLVFSIEGLFEVLRP